MKHSLLVCIVSGAAAVLPNAGAAAPAIGFDPTALETRVDPCVDFYAYACGGWKARNPLPSDHARYSRFEELDERNTLVVKDILEKAAVSRAERSPLERRLGDFYGACMDEAHANEVRLAPVAADLAAVDELGSMRSLPALLADRATKGIPGFFAFGSEQDAQDSAKVIGAFSQGGLGLPSKDYYLDDTENAKTIRAKYLVHVEKMFTLAGEPPARARADAATVMAVETILARGSLNREERRDPKRLYNVKTLAQLQALAPSFDFKAYLAARGARLRALCRPGERSLDRRGRPVPASPAGSLPGGLNTAKASAPRPATAAAVAAVRASGRRCPCGGDHRGSWGGWRG